MFGRNIDMKALAKSFVAAASILVVTMSGPAMAKKISGIKFPAGAMLDIGTIFENSVTAVGDVLTGIGVVDSIKNGAGDTVFWQSGDNGRELTFVFGDFTVEKITFAGTVATIEFSGGFADLFSDPLKDFTATSGLQATDIASASNGAPWLNLLGAGNGTACVVADACPSGAGTPITLVSTVLTAAGDLTTILQGFGAGFLDVDLGGAGAANASFDTNGQPGGQDFALGSSFNGSSSDFPLSGSVDLRGIAVPEPAAMAIFGLGLIGLGAMARRRRRMS